MFDVNMLISTFGLVGIYVIIFMETGVLIGFIFPGDTLLFTAGVAANAENPFAPLWALMVGIPIAASLGDQCGFLIGRTVGPRILHSRAIRWMGDEPLEKTNRFFARYGPATVMFARFFGIIRTLTPVVAGMTHMSHRTFTVFSVLGSVIWGAGFPLLGYLLGEIPFVRDHHMWFVVAGLISAFVPVGIAIWRGKRREKATLATNPPATRT